MRIGMWLLQDSMQHWKKWIAGLYYVRNCIEALATLPPGERPVTLVFAPELLSEPWLDRLLQECGDWLNVVRVSAELTAREARPELMELLQAHRCDLYFPLLNTPLVPLPGRWVGWITDLQHRVYPQYFSAEELSHRDALFDFLLAGCHRVVCSSEAVQTDLRHFFGARCEQTAILRFTSVLPAEALQQDPASCLQRLGIDRPFVYLPYQFWMHKNHRLAFEAWRLLQDRRPDLLLVCTGALEDTRDPYHVPMLQDFLEYHSLQDRIRLLGLVDRNDQWQLYRSAQAVLQPSLFEGWSTSVEEAKSLGQTILLSDIPVHREQASSDCYFFDPRDAAGLADLVVAKCPVERPRPTRSPEEILASARESVCRFGRQLRDLFVEIAAEPESEVARRSLPLLIRYQDIAQERLELIQQLSGRANAPVG